MEPITLATVTSAVVTLALDAAKEAASDTAKAAWGKVKGWLGWEKTPKDEDISHEVAANLKDNIAAVEKIVAELKRSDLGAASRLIAKVDVTVTNTTGDMTAGRDVVSIQGQKIGFGAGTKIGGN